MAGGEHRTTVEYPSELELAVSRTFDAPIELVFDVMTRPEHLRRTVAPFDEEVSVCDVDLRVGGGYQYTFVPPDGPECTFHGTYLEVERPVRTVETWHFGGWPDVEATETMDLSESDGRTTLRITMTFADRAGRAHMGGTDGFEGNFDKIAALLGTLTGGD